MKWVSVKERLPDHDRDVLVLDQPNNYIVARFTNGEWNTGFSNCYGYITWEITDATHWMELPSFPDQEPKECEKPCELCTARHKSNHIKVKK